MTRNLSFIATVALSTTVIPAAGSFISPGPIIPNVPSYIFSMPLDHFNASDHRTFNNRYYLNDTYYKPSSPVFFFDYGESGFSPYYAGIFLAESTEQSAVMQLAKRFNGLAIGWEHRYFGSSLPFPMALGNNTPVTPAECYNSADCTHLLIDSPGSYRYMTVEQALEDANYFARNFELPKGRGSYSKSSLTADKTPWIWIGGSYPGARAAFALIRNPKTFFASWASSAPVQWRKNGSAYFNPIERSLPEPCRTDILASVKYADEILSGEHGKRSFKSLQRLLYLAQETISGLNTSFDISGADSLGVRSIAHGLATAVQDGYQSLGPKATTDILCSFMVAYDPTATPENRTSPEMSVLSNPGTRKPNANGLAATYNSSIAFEAYLYGYRHMESALATTDSQVAPDSWDNVADISWN
ncbi:uncharacterized protein N7496_003201 [Penicillium cataractarum]|uniref:Uncharacterized protein n=1 Tax=Penicillium cataractarum TaxID=2100454 RepID=A0A9W9SQR5_9EURO|nr:uncharacterized protein N7496_003201 [Penicillium cataractarum]KAJ5380773.1 hypothetical protein N7496_003201 [Penicillium cataractarum]